MKMKWIALLPLAVVFAGLLVPDASLSCSCEPPGTPLEELALYDAVFTGRVVAIDQIAGTPEEDVWILFQLSAVWKGALREDIAIRTGPYDAACGYPFEVGGEYLVYAYFLGDGDLYTGLCSRTNSLAAATEDAAQLGEPIFRQVASSVPPMSWGGVKRGHLLNSGTF
ncbi:MAG: hypothetical protein F4Z30_12750 [Gemmatimonadetes bacterium]|nr:hypothetical protein [Gemmatimonadota bacterium]